MTLIKMYIRTLRKACCLLFLLFFFWLDNVSRTIVVCSVLFGIFFVLIWVSWLLRSFSYKDSFWTRKFICILFITFIFLFRKMYSYIHVLKIFFSSSFEKRNNIATGFVIVSLPFLLNFINTISLCESQFNKSWSR